jgi:hypothetical protein
LDQRWVPNGLPNGLSGSDAGLCPSDTVDTSIGPEVSEVIKLVICGALLAHGIGHVLFLAPTIRLAAWADQTGHSWLAEPLIGDGAARLLGAAAWALAMVLFVVAALGAYLDTDWWQPAAAIGAVVSLIAIATFWTGIYTASALFALSFDVIVLIVLAAARWQGFQLAGN